MHRDWQRIVTETRPEWFGDLDDDCSAHWAGLTLRAELMEENRWWWCAYDDGDTQVRSSDEDHYCSTISGEWARASAEQAARQYLRLKAKASVLSPSEHEMLLGWISEAREFWIDLYIAHCGAGSVGYFVRTVTELEELISKQTGNDLQLCVFRRLQYPLRGIADASLLGKALETIPNGEWFRILSLDDYYPFPNRIILAGDTHEEFREVFTTILGSRIAIGQNPFDGSSEWMYSTPDEVLVLNFKKILGQYVRE
jgi:hypothetical protein